MQWEYRVVLISLPHPTGYGASVAQAQSDALSVWGQGGWELVSIAWHDSGTLACALKRQR